MIGPIVLSEYEERRVVLSREDAAFIVSRLGGRVSVGRELIGEGYILNPRQFVGLAALPSGRTLACRPKVPARNLFLMLDAAFDLPVPFLDAPADTDTIEDVVEFVVARFASLVEERVDRGLYRAYVEDEGNLAMVRGRIAIAEDVRRNHVLRHRTWCRYAEYSWDIPENQVLRQVVRLLVGWRLRPELRRRLHVLDAILDEVTPGRYVASDVDRFVYHRLNEDYRPLHRLCRLFLEGASPSEDAGTFAFEAFFMDMNRLFEAFVTRVLRDRAPAGVAVQPQVTVPLDEARAVRMRPDIVVRRGGQVVLTADCKYKRVAPGSHIEGDLYQLVAYCTALGVERGLLIYPRHLAPMDGEIAVRHSRLTIWEAAIDLGGDRTALDAECDRLARVVFDLVPIMPVTHAGDAPAA